MSATALRWIATGNVGTSSRTIWAVLMGTVPPMPPDSSWREFDVPHDPDDFSRCHALLEAVSEWRTRLSEVADVFPEWGPLVESWAELETMFAAVVAGPRWNLEASTRMYERMQALIDEGRRQAKEQQ